MIGKQDIKYVASTVAFGTACSAIVGLLFFGLKIFNIKLPFFQFIAYGITGSVSFSLFQLRRNRDAIYVLIMLFIVDAVIAGLTRLSFLITHFLFFSSVIIAAYLFSKYLYNQSASLKISRPLILAGILAILFLAVTVLMWIIFGKNYSPFNPLANLPTGFLIGLGLGIGFEISERIAFNF